MATTVYHAAEPLSIRNWELYVAEVQALMDDLMAEYPRLSASDAHRIASDFVDGSMEEVCNDWDLMVAQFERGCALVIIEEPGRSLAA